MIHKVELIGPGGTTDWNLLDKRRKFRSNIVAINRWLSYIDIPREHNSDMMGEWQGPPYVDQHTDNIQLWANNWQDPDTNPSENYIRPNSIGRFGSSRESAIDWIARKLINAGWWIVIVNSRSFRAYKISPNGLDEPLQRVDRWEDLYNGPGRMEIPDEEPSVMPPGDRERIDTGVIGPRIYAPIDDLAADGPLDMDRPEVEQTHPGLGYWASVQLPTITATSAISEARQVNAAIQSQGDIYRASMNQVYRNIANFSIQNDLVAPLTTPLRQGDTWVAPEPSRFIPDTEMSRLLTEVNDVEEEEPF